MRPSAPSVLAVLRQRLTARASAMSRKPKKPKDLQFLGQWLDEVPARPRFTAFRRDGLIVVNYARAATTDPDYVVQNEYVVEPLTHFWLTDHPGQLGWLLFDYLLPWMMECAEEIELEYMARQGKLQPASELVH